MIAQYYCCLQSPAYPTIIQRARYLFRLRTSFSWLFQRRSSLTPQQTRDSECHCCLTVKHNYTSNLYLLFHWYCERGGDNDESLTWRRDLINLFSPKDVYRRALFFFLARWLPSRARRCFRKERKEK